MESVAEEAAAEADKPPEQNFVRKHAMEQAAAGKSTSMYKPFGRRESCSAPQQSALGGRRCVVSQLRKFGRQRSSTSLSDRPLH